MKMVFFNGIGEGDWLNSLPTPLRNRFLECFSKSYDRIVRRFVARDPRTPIHIIEILINDSDLSVKRNASVNYANRIAGTLTKEEMWNSKIR